MAKTKAKKFHKIKIHHNRWLIWAIAYMLFVTIALVGYLKVSDIIFDAESAQNQFEPSHSYNDQRLGFSLRYPANWAIEADTESVTFSPNDLTEYGVTVTQTVPSAERAIRKTLSVLNESSVQVDSVMGSRLTNFLGNGASEVVVIAQHKQKLYVIRGPEFFVEKMLLTLKLK